MGNCFFLTKSTLNKSEYIILLDLSHNFKFKKINE